MGWVGFLRGASAAPRASAKSGRLSFGGQIKGFRPLVPGVIWAGIFFRQHNWRASLIRCPRVAGLRPSRGWGFGSLTAYASVQLFLADAPHFHAGLFQASPGILLPSSAARVVAFDRQNRTPVGGQPVEPEPRIRMVILIPAVLLLGLIAAAVAVPVCVGQKHGSGKPARMSIETIKQMLGDFHAEYGRFPTTAEGLDALVHPPAGAAQRPLAEKIPLDPWNQPFVYRCPSTTGRPFYDLYSIGPDGIDGTADDIHEAP